MRQPGTGRMSKLGSNKGLPPYRRWRTVHPRRHASLHFRLVFTRTVQIHLRDGDPSPFFRPCVVNFLVQGGLLPNREHGQVRPCGGQSDPG